MQDQYINLICYLWIGIALAAHVAMFYITAPYGRHSSKQWGPTMNNKLGWFVMELPSLLIMLYFLYFGSNSFQSYVWILFMLWIFHYVNRTCIFPLRIKGKDKQIPISIVANGIIFNLVNAGLNGYFLAELSQPEDYNTNWLTSSHFIFGIAIFFIGMYINMRSDNILIRLRDKHESGYRIPKGFLFKYVASPNLFGEIIEWTGFAIMAWNLPALTFMIWTYSNLVPRAKNHYDWNLRYFKDYPKDRKVIFPFVY